MEKVRGIIDSCHKEFPDNKMEVRFDEPMSLHTSFKVGGKADAWIKPHDLPRCAAFLLGECRRENVPLFVLGGGANIVVADRGIRGIVLDTSAWTGIADDFSGYECSKFGHSICLRSGTSADNASEIAAGEGLSGLEFLAGMPGSIGGAVWMNARCYEKEIADVLLDVKILEWDQDKGTMEIKSVIYRVADFGYKKSPFQNRDALILEARFALNPQSGDLIRSKMAEYRQDREAKGHYRFPSGGSAFKNNRDYGKPTGMIIDELGLKGLSMGGAQVAPFHGNIIINTGSATASDIRGILESVALQVKEATGHVLEPELLFIGDW